MPSKLPAAYVAEFNDLYDALPIAIKRACQILQHSSSSSAAFLAADREVSRILARINELTNDCLRIPHEVISAPVIDDPPEAAWGR